MNVPTILVSASILSGMAVLFLRRDLLEKLIEALNNFRGGPPTAMHPSPADDGRLLRRRARKVGD